MSRGSKIGERRGGRDRGTPDGRTLFVDRILAIASECLANNPRKGFIAVLVQGPESYRRTSVWQLRGMGAHFHITKKRDQ